MPMLRRVHDVVETFERQCQPRATGSCATIRDTGIVDPRGLAATDPRAPVMAEPKSPAPIAVSDAAISRRAGSPAFANPACHLNADRPDPLLHSHRPCRSTPEQVQTRNPDRLLPAVRGFGPPRLLYACGVRNSSNKRNGRSGAPGWLEQTFVQPKHIGCQGPPGAIQGLQAMAAIGLSAQSLEAACHFTAARRCSSSLVTPSTALRPGRGIRPGSRLTASVNARFDLLPP
ncbi:MAG: hypothetical protein JWN59_1261 [Sphingomonas bacterium]|nr:hypothetical protein [Sphingomonas bacterium]